MRPISDFGFRISDLKDLRKTTRFPTGILLLAVFCLLSFGVAEAQARQVEEVKEIAGEVGFLRADMISVEYYRKGGSAKEVLISLDGGTALKTIGNLTEIKEGDTVRVTYKETYVLNQDGTRSDLKRVATQISLVRRAPADSLLQALEPREGKLQ